MEKWLPEITPIMDVERDCILSKQGDISIVFKVTLPELFTQSDDNYEAVHQSLIKAIRVLPKDSVFHKQDYFVQRRYREADQPRADFLLRSARRHFEGRPYLQHDCFIILTKKPSGRKPASSVFSSLLRPTIVPEQTISTAALQQWEDSAGQFARLLSDSGIRLERLREADLVSRRDKVGFIERYYTLSEDPEQRLVKDLQLKDRLQIGEQHGQLFTLADTADLPPLCGPRITYDKYSTDKTKFPIGFASAVGLLLPCNHLYSQYIFIGDTAETLKKLESKRLRLQSLAGYSRENAIARDAVGDFLNECVREQRLPVKAHFNVLVWTDNPAELPELRNQVTAALARMEAATKLETAGAAQIWWAGIPGNGGDFPMNDTFDTFAEQACCFIQVDTNYRSDPPESGIRFCDRLTGKPVYADLFDLPRTTYGWTSNMGLLCCGTSGGGKSMTLNHLLKSLYNQGAHAVVVDIGGSYKGLCELVGGYYFTYTEENPIRFNPFYLPEGVTLDTEKKESLKALLVSLWKRENETFNRAEYVALSNALSGYYDFLKTHPDVFPCFNSFYEYLEQVFTETVRAHQVKEKDFDISNFLYVLRPYFRGGEFDYLLNATGNLDLLTQRFVVFELDAIAGNPILFPVVTLIIMELFISKMRKLTGTRKVLIIDEAWKAIASSGMAEFLRYAFKTIRKYNGIPGVVTQELDDLVSSPIIKDAIINNADIKILMDMRKFLHKFDKLQEVLGLSEKAKTILLSVNRDNREIFIDLGGQMSKVYKNELCPEEYLAYTTDGKERVKVMEYAGKYGSYEKGIQALADELRTRSINNKK